MKKQNQENEDRRLSPYYFVGVAFEFVGLLLMPILLGLFLDRRYFPGSAWFTIGGVVLGFSYGLWHLYRSAMLAQERGIKEIENPFKGSRSEKSVQKRADEIHGGLNDVGRRVDELLKKERKRKK